MIHIIFFIRQFHHILLSCIFNLLLTNDDFPGESFKQSEPVINVRQRQWKQMQTKRWCY